MKEIEKIVEKELNFLEAKNFQIKDVKINVVRDAVPEYKTTKPYAATIMILYN